MAGNYQQTPKQDTSRYEEIPENDVVWLAQQGDKQAEEYLIDSNIDIVYSKSKLFYIKGLDNDDVIQEGLVGLYKAIRDYKIKREASFRGFAHLCVSRQLISAIKTANRQKHMPLNNSTSINKKLNYSKDDGGRGRTLLDILPDQQNDPEKDYVNRELVGEVTNQLRDNLTKLEWDVFDRYIQGKSYREIAAEIEGSVKTVDNALQRARRKIDELREKLKSEVGDLSIK
ncbi:RNA polymerase sigma factor, sigma-70 family [Halobacteroides halobius DSM 5150]|uniref:RNA polymerase sigma factor, sigma-70 family n=1 Tax=Halobacteroides halobius (strain ATCC 35273 / DSM 5150 / MD-1) TaxID=748449 RepID=L0KAW5_HALHC|nr:RNA polymerase sporulation sigma factor SigH [Halobacteroides halobius]AGB42156.1 RNA polymerase sigma factor, sigma-70 family [Halobacteroides halobius DSM 5150]